MLAINATSNVNITTRITTTNFMCKKREGDEGGEQHVRSNVVTKLVGLYLDIFWLPVVHLYMYIQNYMYALLFPLLLLFLLVVIGVLFFDCQCN